MGTFNDIRIARIEQKLFDEILRGAKKEKRTISSHALFLIEIGIDYLSKIDAPKTWKIELKTISQIKKEAGKQFTDKEIKKIVSKFKKNEGTNKKKKSKAKTTKI